MSDPPLTRITPNCRLELVNVDKSLTPEAIKVADQIWKNELAANPKLFNGSQLSVEEIEPSVIRCRVVEYRFVLAQLRQPELFREFDVRPLALTVVLETENSIVFGKRSKEVSQSPGFWEPAPSGGIELTNNNSGADSIKAQALRELREELGVEPRHLDLLMPIAVHEDPGSHVADICVLARTNISAQTLLTIFNKLSGWEYETITMVPVAQLQQFAAQNHGRLVAPTLPFLRECNFL